jgi:GntR family transcriptional regulator
MPTPRKWPAVVDALRRRIATGEYQPGDRLPAEYRLTEEFAVSLPVIRTALQVLRDQGFIKTVMGSGSFVCASGESTEGVVAFTYEVRRYSTGNGGLWRTVLVSAADRTVFETENHDPGVTDEQAVTECVDAFAQRLRAVLSERPRRRLSSPATP